MTLSRPLLLTLAVLAGIAVLVPVLNGMGIIPNYLIPLFGKYACYALLAVALNLVWGQCGVLSLGHGAFFALGGYAMGMHLMRNIGTRGSYGNANLPDFMVFLNWKELPWYWSGFDILPFALLMALVVPGLLAFVLGGLAFRSRITGVYLSIITQAMTYALMLAFFRNEMGFGGNNGLTDFKDIAGFELSNPGTRVGFFILSVLALGGGLLLTWALGQSKLGRVMVAVRDAESRLRFLGYSATNVKLAAFVLSAMLAGLAGALYVPQVGIINPSEFSPANSIEIAIMVALGGRGTLIGPVVGAVTLAGAKSWLTGIAPDLWPFALGALFILVTLLLPKGLVGLKLPKRAAKPVEPTAVEEKTHA
ncbi:urea ABC transporter permease subunit UrtC [Lacibacterium aquatile]|uniref:Urea ABC transporter permease subunit UrtC n=1 Tax=Lacibacterium aquatile TaxID=1168082 RepID=A0ABW5DKC0_9PROT